MKDNSLDGHRGKVALSDTTRNTSAPQSSASSTGSVAVKCDLKASPSTTTGTANDGSAATNFDDDYNEWELGIGDLIIDLDADIEKTNGGGPQQGIPTSSSHHSHHHGHHHHHHHHHHHSSNHQQNGTASSVNPGSDSSPSGSAPATTFNFLGSSQPPSSNLAAAMSNSKSPRITGNSGSGSGASSVSGTGTTANSSGSGTFEHQATVDKGLKMKIKRKTVGNKYSEAKHEIVQSDTKASAASSSQSSSENSSNSSNNCSSNASGSNSPAASSETPKSKHSSSKGRTSSHREKKEKNRDKDKSSSARNSAVNSNSANVTTTSEVNGVGGVLGVMSPIKITNSGVSLSSPAPPPLSTNSSPLPSSTPVPSPSMSRSVANSPAGLVPQDSVIPQVVTGPPAPLIGQQAPTTQGPTSSSSPPMPNLTLKLESKFTPSPLPAVVIKQEERPSSPPLKKIKLEPTEKNEEVECPGSPELSPEMKDTSTCTSVGTITEPDCLGPCEPGTSVMLEGIVWQETEGGVLVVNVTWRGKTYVGTLLDCTKHDWAPPRFCESPTSDVDSKTSKGRGKRGRGGNNSSSDINTFADARNCVQSKLRNGKGRRTTINSNASSSGFTVPNSPAKSENGSTNSKRKGRPADLEISTPPVDSNNKNSKRSRTQNRSTPTSSAPAEFPQPSSPVLIVCPEPNCNKKYKHINGLRYHQTHAHSASDSSKMDDTTTEDSKDVTNSSDNEESMQESASVSTSPAPSFSNTVPSHPTAEKIMLNDTALSSSSSSNMNSLPENDLFNLSTDLSTLASVAISDSKAEPKSSRPVPVPLHSAVPQEMPVVNSDGDDAVPASGLPASNPSPTATSVSSSILPVASLSPSSGTGLSTPVSAVTTSVIQSSSSVDSTPISQAVTVSIPASHVIFNQGLPSSVNTTACYTASSVVCNNSNPLSPSRSSLPPSNVTSTFASISSISSTSATSPSAIDKTKIKQERPDKYKPKSPVATPAIRPIVPAPTLHTLPGNVPGSLNPMGLNNHGVIGSPLKPIQPKPTTLGEPTIVNPSLEGLKKEKSKHKKKSKDKDRDKKLPPLPLTPTKLNMNSNEECEAIELTSYPSLEAVSESSLPLPGTAHAALSTPLVTAKPPDAAMEIGMPDDSINENIQSPAYSDISDANDTAPVLESEVPAGKEKEEKLGKTTPDASQSPAANISAYGMYPYYSQPPYLIPSVSPQSAVSGSQAQTVVEKSELNKKTEQERVKESRPWSNPSGESRERPHIEHHEPEKKPREESVPIPNAIPSPAAPGGPVQEYPIQQHYPYPYGYVQGYPYPIEPSSYHMHMLESDPHYKQQYKQYIEEQQRLYKEQQHHHQQQQLQQQLHHQQHQSQHHGHQSHHSQHQSHHQSKSQHHVTVKEERDRSRESKDKSGNLDKMSNSGLIVEHSSKIQHSSMSLVSNKEHDVREIDSRPPSLPAQARLESSNSASVAALKEKQNENHQILKENIELKSQMDDNKNKMNQYAMLFEMQREDMRRYYMYQDRVIEQQQQKLEPGIHHHTHHHQTIQPHGHLQAPSASYSSPSSLKPHKEDHSSSIPSHSKSSHYGENSRSSTISPAKSDHVKNPHSNSTSSPKGSIRDSSLGRDSKDYMSSASSRESTSSSKKDSQSKNSERSESSGREDKKGDKIKVEPKVEPEGQKPTMETTGPPPPPTNSYAYLHPSYLQPTPTHFPHMPFEPAHAMYRGGINPMLVSSPHYGGSPYVHPQIRYVTPGACEIPAHPQQPEPKMHPSGPPKALDLLHQVSQHYTTTHKIHELQEHAMMSPTPTSTPSSTPSAVSSGSGGSKSSSSEPAVAVAKMDGGSRDASRSPPTQRHLHTHHHTHVGVTYPIYDPYGAIVAPGPPPPVDCKPIHPMQVKSPAASARYWQ